jgi:hypothetical protein
MTLRVKNMKEKVIALTIKNTQKTLNPKLLSAEVPTWTKSEYK